MRVGRGKREGWEEVGVRVRVKGRKRVGGMEEGRTREE